MQLPLISFRYSLYPFHIPSSISVRPSFLSTSPHLLRSIPLPFKDSLISGRFFSTLFIPHLWQFFFLPFSNSLSFLSSLVSVHSMLSISFGYSLFHTVSGSYLVQSISQFTHLWEQRIFTIRVFKRRFLVVPSPPTPRQLYGKKGQQNRWDLCQLGAAPAKSIQRSFLLDTCGGCLWNLGNNPSHRLNMELDLKRLFGLLCTAVLIGWDPATPPLSTYLGSYTWTLLVSQDRRHLFVTPWSQLSSARIYRPSFHENKPKTLVFT